MTFDSGNFPPSFPHEGEPFSEIESHVDMPPLRKNLLSNCSEEAQDEYCHDTEIANWESEGGAYFDRPSRIHRRERISPESKLTGHIIKAEAHIEAGDYDAAHDELVAAAKRFMRYKDKISQSFNMSISRLSTLGCHASPPHPKALSLTRLRQQIIA